MDQKLDDMSAALMSRFALMLEQFKVGLKQSSLSGDPAVPGPSVSQTEPPSLQHPISTKSREGLRFWESGEGPVPHGSGLAQGDSSSARHVLGVEAETSRDPPLGDGDKSQRPGVQSGPGFGLGYPNETDYAFHPEGDDDDDKDSVVDPPVLDRTYTRLVSFIYDRFSHSRPSANAHVPPRCEFEDFFAVSDPPSASRQNLTVYPRVAEIVNSSV